MHYIARQPRLDNLQRIITFFLFAFSSLSVLASEVSLFIEGSARATDRPLVVNSADTNSPVAVSESRVVTASEISPFARASFGAAANLGSLAAEVRSVSTGSFLPTGNGILDVDAHGFASARFQLDDIVFTSPNANINSALLLNVSGTLNSGVFTAASDVYALATNNFMVSVTLTGPGLNFNSFGSIGSQKEINSGELTPTVTDFVDGVFVGEDFATPISFGMFTAPTNVALSLSVEVSVAAAAALDSTGGLPPYSGNADSDALFGSTINFPTDGAAFLLGAGESASSTSGSIANGIWLGTPVSITTVPIPGGLLLMLIPLCTVFRYIQQ